MKRWQRGIIRTPVLGAIALIVFRALRVAPSLGQNLWNVMKWLINSNETTNLTYDLDQSNIRHLACLISNVLDLEYSTVMGYFDELQQNDHLKQHIVEATERSDRAMMADREARFGRRMGWYAIARALKPKVIVETGVDKGLGACMLAAALIKNREEGHAGKYFGTDINPAAGYLLSGEYAEMGEILYGDSIESLTRFDYTIDMFINDSDHSAEYERNEYLVVANKLSKNAIILGDNSDITDELLDFSLATGRHFVFFSEKSKGHWFAGGGIGISFVGGATEG